MKIKNRVSSVPAFIQDPYFSIWSPYDKLTDGALESWTGKAIPINGYIKYEDQMYRFMGFDELTQPMKQISF